MYKARKYTSALLTAAITCSIAQSQISSDRNYVISNTVKAPGYTTQAQVDALLEDKKQQQVNYYDGLGRPLQAVMVKANPNKKDIITPIEYDGYGREIKKFLPYADVNGTTNFGSLRTTAYADQATFYTSTSIATDIAKDNYPFSQAHYEFSPFNRVTEAGAPGQTWQPGSTHGVKPLQSLNSINDDVKRWTVAYTTDAVPSVAGAYNANDLHKNISFDEHGKQVVEYKDREGKIILKKVQLSNTPSASYAGWLCTYYIYDDYNNLRYVIQPKGVEWLAANAWTFPSSPAGGGQVGAELCFRYEYDARGRMIIKKVPGAKEVQMVYDARDRLVMTQDVNLKNQGLWLVTLYDEKNLPVKTGLWASSLTGDQQRSAAYNSTAYPFAYDNTPGSGFELLSETYYDGYSSLPTALQAYDNSFNTYFQTPTGNFPYAEIPVNMPVTRSLVTGAKIKVLGSGTPGQFLYSATFYDDKGRAVQTKAENLSGGVDITTTQYSYAGLVLVVVQRQQKNGTNPQTHTVITKMDYDDEGRLLNVKKTVSSTINGTAVNKAEQTIVSNQYNTLNELLKKILAPGFNGNSNGIENLNYEYNIRGWLSGINKKYIKNEQVNKFGFELGYDNPVPVISTNNYIPQYNNNISGTIWKTIGDGETRRYDFTYDNTRRLTFADFNQYTGGTFNKNAGLDFTVSNLTYDANGNIMTMHQKGWKQSSSDFIDQLSYNYYNNSNRLLNIIDTRNDPQTKLGDFRTSLNHPVQSKTSSTVDYTYDDNGNMTKDLNKDIATISNGDGLSYNYLNLPTQILVKNKGSIEYLYDATGKKIKKTLKETGNPDKVTLYIGDAVYEDDVLQFFSHEDGRIRFEKATTSTCPAMPDRYVMDFFIKDHLGNIRMVLTDQQETRCYPSATVEDARVASEQNYYAISTNRIVDKSTTGATQASMEAKVYRTNGGVSSEKTGLGIVLKVMAGDVVKIRVESFYNLPGGGAGTPLTMAAMDLINSLIAGIGFPLNKGITATDVNNISGNPALINGFITNNPYNSTTAKAYLNWVLFDDRFKYVTGDIDQVQANGGFKAHEKFFATSPVNITRNGYLYIYVSNESNFNVFFDNLSVTHIPGDLLETNEYYPFGLIQQAISSKSFGKIENRRKYNKGTELNSWFDINLYETNFRNLDPQIGRFHQIDAMEGLANNLSPYLYAGNNPISYNDPLGLWKDSIKTKNGEYAYANNPDLAPVVVKPKPKAKRNWLGWPQFNKDQRKWNDEMYARQRDGQQLIQGNEPSWVLDHIPYHKRRFKAEKEYRQMSIAAVLMIGSPVLIASLTGTAAGSFLINAGFTNPLALSGRLGQIAKVKAIMGVGNAAADAYYQVTTLSIKGQLSFSNYNYGGTLGNLFFTNPLYSSLPGAINSSLQGESFISSWGKGFLGDAIGNIPIPGGGFGLRLGMEGFTLPLLGNLTSDILTGGFIEPNTNKEN